jgi:hypothetical protein
MSDVATSPTLASPTLTRWTAEQVLALAPDASAQKAARGLASARPWRDIGCHDGDPPTLWGLCKGSGANPYQTCVDLAEPAYRCSCPSRKFPCKHALGLLLLWAAGGVDSNEPPAWVKEWHGSRADRRAKASTTPARSGPSPKAQAQRAARVAAGLDELDRWLGDQVRSGLAGASSAGYGHWEAMAARLIDAQAPGAASAVRALAGAASNPTGERLLAELALLRLLVTGYRRIGELPEPLAATVRGHVGVPVPTEEVLAGPPVRDRWSVVGVRDETEDRLTVRRAWLHGIDTGRSALVLSFAAPGQALSADLVVGSTLDADLCFFPGALPLRALVGTRHGLVAATVPAGATVAAALRGYAEAMAADPWLARWPMLLAEVVPGQAKSGSAAGSGRWYLVDSSGNGLPLDPAVGVPWRLVAACGGHPATVAAEWSPAGLRPLTAWVDGKLVRP